MSPPSWGPGLCCPQPTPACPLARNRGQSPAGGCWLSHRESRLGAGSLPSRCKLEQDPVSSADSPLGNGCNFWSFSPLCSHCPPECIHSSQLLRICLCGDGAVGRLLGDGHGWKEHISPFKHYYSTQQGWECKNSHQSDRGASESGEASSGCGGGGSTDVGGVGVSRVWGCPGCCYPTQPGHQDQLQGMG